jgi:putative transposase
MLILGRRHLEAVLGEYAEHYNSHRPHRPHRPLSQRAPSKADMTPGLIGNLNAEHLRRSDVLGGLIHEYRLGRELADEFSAPTPDEENR